MTSLWVAMMRELDNARAQPFLGDQIVERLLTDQDRTLVLRQILAGSRLESSWASSLARLNNSALAATLAIQELYAGDVVLRQRRMEDLLRVAVDAGVRQYLILGAGFETVAFRQCEWMSHISVLETDHPATQRLKLERVRRAGIAKPANVEFHALDLECPDLERTLRRFGLVRSVPTFVSMLGVAPYLAPTTNRRILQVLFDYFERVEVVFDYFDQERMLPIHWERFRRETSSVGEEWVSRWPARILNELAESIGYRVESNLPHPEVAARHYPHENPGPVWQAMALAHLVR